jgi:hypothetical protein
VSIIASVSASVKVISRLALSIQGQMAEKQKETKELEGKLS